MKYSIVKSSLIFAILMSFSFAMNAQESDSTKTDSTKSSDDWKISIGKTKIIIKKGADSDTLSLADKKEEKKVRQRMSHFAGIDIGINGLLSPGKSVDLQRDAQFLELNYSRSVEISLNFWEKYIPIAKEKFGITTGAGLKYNSYDLIKDVVIVNQMDSTFSVEDPTRSISKNRFKTNSLYVPLMLETNIGKDADHSFFLAIGGTAGYTFGTRTKQKYKQGGDQFKNKDRNDFNVNDFQFAAVARVGYGKYTLYGSYNLTPLFDKNKGPEVYPFSIGISIGSF